MCYVKIESYWLFVIGACFSAVYFGSTFSHEQDMIEDEIQQIESQPYNNSLIISLAILSFALFDLILDLILIRKTADEIFLLFVTRFFVLIGIFITDVILLLLKSAPGLQTYWSVIHFQGLLMLISSLYYLRAFDNEPKLFQLAMVVTIFSASSDTTQIFSGASHNSLRISSITSYTLLVFSGIAFIYFLCLWLIRNRNQNNEHSKQIQYFPMNVVFCVHFIVIFALIFWRFSINFFWIDSRIEDHLCKGMVPINCYIISILATVLSLVQGRGSVGRPITVVQVRRYVLNV